MHNYIINDRILFNTFTGGLSRLDDPKQLIVLSNNAKRLFIRLIDNGYQIVPLEYLSAELKVNNDANMTEFVVTEIEHISDAFHHINETEQILIVYPYGVQLSTDVELKVVTSYRSFKDNSEEKPYIAKEQLFNPSRREQNSGQSSSRQANSHFGWYYTRIALVITLFVFLLYFALNLFSSKPGYYADYYFQGKYNACSVYIHNQKPTDLSHLKMRIDQFAIPCDTPKNIYFSLPADDKRESIQICQSDPDSETEPCTNFYVVKVK